MKAFCTQISYYSIKLEKQEIRKQLKLGQLHKLLYSIEQISQKKNGNLVILKIYLAFLFNHMPKQSFRSTIFTSRERAEVSKQRS